MVERSGCISKDENLAAVEKYGVAENTTIFAGVINGRNIWRNNYAVSLGVNFANLADISLSSFISLVFKYSSTIPFS